MARGAGKIAMARSERGVVKEGTSLFHDRGCRVMAQGHSGCCLTDSQIDHRQGRIQMVEDVQPPALRIQSQTPRSKTYGNPIHDPAHAIEHSDFSGAES